jgi:hypothetical protein
MEHPVEQFSKQWYFVSKNFQTYCEKKSFQKNFWNSRLKAENLQLKQDAFLTCSWRFLKSNTVEPLQFKSGKILEFKNLQEKLEKVPFICNIR